MTTYKKLQIFRRVNFKIKNLSKTLKRKLYKNQNSYPENLKRDRYNFTIWTERGKREIDIIAVNGEEVVAVEVKTTLKPDDVKYFMETLKIFKHYFSIYKNKSVYGAVAYLRSEAEAPIFAEKQGLFVIRATEDSASIINKKDFKPKAF